MCIKLCGLCKSTLLHLLSSISPLQPRSRRIPRTNSLPEKDTALQGNHLQRLPNSLHVWHAASTCLQRPHDSKVPLTTLVRRLAPPHYRRKRIAPDPLSATCVPGGAVHQQQSQDSDSKDLTPRLLGMAFLLHHHRARDTSSGVLACSRSGTRLHRHSIGWLFQRLRA